MADLNKDLVTSKGKSTPQYLDENTDRFEVAMGANGAPFYRSRGSIAMEAWEGSAAITKTFSDYRYGFSIINDGTADLTFTIGGQSRTVKPGEAYSALFEPFKEVEVNATSAYRAEVLK